MKIFGLEITRHNMRQREQLTPLYGANTWQNIYSAGTVLESFPGAWQQNVRLERTTMLAFSPVYACVTGIASDVAKLRIKLTEDQDGIWEEITKGSPWLPVLAKPNHYQNAMQFREQWLLSKLLAGNTYVLKERDDRGGQNQGIVRAMYILDPTRVTPLISEDGDIYYRLQQDYLNQISDDAGIVVPASEIMHDMMPGIFNPLVGTSPLYAAMVSVGQGNAIQSNSSKFFSNLSMPGGMLSAPGKIADDTAKRMKAAFEESFGGKNIGRLLVAGDGIIFSPFAMTAEQSQLVEQLKWAVSDVARVFHYPEYKLGGPLPPYSANMQALTLSYFTDCLQVHIESMESCLDEGLELPPSQEVELDIDNLMRMDSLGLAEVHSKIVTGGIEAPNEGRRKFNLPPVKGGDSPYLQQQNYSLEALAKRDAQADPFATNTPAASPTPPQIQPSPTEREHDPVDVEFFDSILNPVNL